MFCLLLLFKFFFWTFPVKENWEILWKNAKQNLEFFRFYFLQKIIIAFLELTSINLPKKKTDCKDNMNFWNPFEIK